MSGGGMDWAYRTIAAHGAALDGLGVAIILHLGWREHPNHRTDRGIAAALGRQRISVRKATLKLAAMGIIERRSHQWVSCETIAIVEQRPGAPLPDPDFRDDEAGSSGAHQPEKGRAPEEPVGGLLRSPQKGSSGAHKRKETIEKEGPPSVVVSFPADPANLTRFERDRLLAGHAVLLGGVLVKPDAPEWSAFALAVRAQAAEKVQVRL